MEKEFRQRFEDVDRVELSLDLDRQAFPGVLINNRQHPKRSTVAGPVHYKIVRPDVILTFRTEPEAGAVIQPESPSFGLTSGNFKPFLTPYPLHAFAVHSPSLMFE